MCAAPRINLLPDYHAARTRRRVLSKYWARTETPIPVDGGMRPGRELRGGARAVPLRVNTALAPGH